LGSAVRDVVRHHMSAPGAIRTRAPASGGSGSIRPTQWFDLHVRGAPPASWLGVGHVFGTRAARWHCQFGRSFLV